ncbi:MAG: lactate racemase domain-containing protein [Desulfobacterales bacterium]|nr:lactate racemase domain-containing protein [Desulfobacterales bacterium]
MTEELMKVSLVQRPWYGDTRFEIGLPKTWDVTVCTMPGQDGAKVTKKEIEAAFANPIGTPGISSLARGKGEVALIFDDLSRPTRAMELVPYILREIRKAGIDDESIRFVAAAGAHGAMKQMDFEKKLGKRVVRKFPVFNHNPYENCTYLGKTSRGTPVHINSEVMGCDLKIAIGCIVPHPTAGFGGGAKIMIGLSHVDTIYANHHDIGGRSAPTPGNPMGTLHPSLGFGKVEGNVLRADLEEMARMAGIDCIVNVIVNGKRESIGVFVGDVVTAHREGVKMARKVYATESGGGFDLLVVNAYSKANEASLAMQGSPGLLKEEGGDLVLICNTPEGQICHYTGRSFGKVLGGRLWGPRKTLPPRVKRMIAVGSGIDRAGLDWIGPADAVIRVKEWAEALKILKGWHGNAAKVGVVPDGTIQYFPDQV